MGFLKKIAKKAFKYSPIGLAVKAVEKILPSSGKSAAKRAIGEANALAAEATSARVSLEEKTKKERAKAQKLAIKGLRSKRAANYFKNEGGESTTYGSTTIG